jgi:hypothetical protein
LSYLLARGGEGSAPTLMGDPVTVLVAGSITDTVSLPEL